MSWSRRSPGARLAIASGSHSAPSCCARGSPWPVPWAAVRPTWVPTCPANPCCGAGTTTVPTVSATRQRARYDSHPGPRRYRCCTPRQARSIGPRSGPARTSRRRQAAPGDRPPGAPTRARFTSKWATDAPGRAGTATPPAYGSRLIPRGAAGPASFPLRCRYPGCDWASPMPGLRRAVAEHAEGLSPVHLAFSFLLLSGWLITVGFAPG